MRVPSAIALFGSAAVLLGACGSGGSGAATASSAPSSAQSSAPVAAQTAELAVTATDDACQLNASTLVAGKVTVTATSSASGEAEVYLYGQEAGGFTKIMGEAEGLTSGLSKSFTADVPAGPYEVKCETGGKELRVPITAK